MHVTPHARGAVATAPQTASVHPFTTGSGRATGDQRAVGQPDGAGTLPGEGAHVLIVDDDPSILRMLRIVFLGDGFEVTTATNGQEALNAVQERMPGVIVLDLEMPIMDGREFFRELRARGHAVPVLILSAYGAERARLELKAEAFVSKPFEPDYLVGEVQKLLMVS
ncbi:MAG: response regulator [Dehalococcoidia bacterium]|nr:response regulator [Dehalococcoidia bacterium]